MARRRYFGRRRRGRGKVTVPLVPCIGAAALGGMLAFGPLNKPGDTPAAYLQQGNFNSAGIAFTRNAMNPTTYVLPLAIIIGGAVAKKFAGKMRVTRGLSVL